MIKYRSFKPDDAKQVFDVARKSWKETYKEIFKDDYIEQFLNHPYNPINLRNTILLMDKGLTEFYVADIREKIIGFVQIRFSNYNLEKKDPKNHILLYRIYIDPRYLGKKIGSTLYSQMEKWVENESRSEYGCFCHKKNVLGKQFYQYKNFKHISERDNKEENEILFLKQLK